MRLPIRLSCLTAFFVVCNATFSPSLSGLAKNSIYVIATPHEFQDNQNFTVAVSIEELAEPVTFNLSLFKENTLIAPSILMTLKSETTNLVSFGTPEIFSEVKSEKPDLQLFVSAHTPSKGNIQNDRELISKSSSSRYKIFIQTNKENYIVGERIFYLVIVFDRFSRRPQKFSKPISIQFSGHSGRDYPLINKIASPSLSSSGLVHYGNVTAHGNFKKIVVNIPEQNLTKFRQFQVREAQPPQFFKVELNQPEFLFPPESKLKLNLSFLTTENSLPVDGHCTVSIKRTDYYLRWREPIKKVVNMSSTIYSRQLEFDISTEIDIPGVQNYRPYDYEKYIRESSVKFVTFATCIHSHSGIQTKGIAKNYAKYFVREMFQLGFWFAKILPNVVSNLTPVTVEFQIIRREGIPIQQNDFWNRTLNVTLDFSDAVLSSKEYDGKYNFNFTSLPPNGIVKLRINVKDLISPHALVTKSLIHAKFAEQLPDTRSLLWNLRPRIHISPLEPHLSINGGDIVKFHLCSTDSSIQELNLTTVLHSREGIITTNRISLAMTGEEGGVFELQIPKEIINSTLIHLTVYSKCPFDFISQEYSNSNLRKCVMNAFTSFYVNIPKPILHVNKVNRTNTTIEITLGITHGLRNIKHVSLALSEVKKEIQVNHLARSCENKYREEFVDKFFKSKDQLSLVSNGYTQYESRPQKILPQDAQFFEFDILEDNNGSVPLALSLNSELYTKEFKVSAIVLSDSEGGLSYTNEIEIKIPTSNIIINMPFVPNKMIVGEELQLTGMITNNSPFKLQEEVYFEYYTEVSHYNYTKQSISISIDPESRQTLQLIFQPRTVGSWKIKLMSTTGPIVEKNIEVVPNGKLVKLTKSRLVETEKQNISDETTKFTIPADCIRDDGTRVTTKNFQDDIFGDLKNSELANSSKPLELPDSRLTRLNWLSIAIALQATSSQKIFENAFTFFSPFAKKVYCSNDLSTREIIAICHLEKYLFDFNTLKKLQEDLYSSPNFTTLLELQTADGSFTENSSNCQRDNSTANGFLERTFMRTIFGLLALDYKREAEEDRLDFENHKNMGLRFLNNSLETITSNSSILDDKYPMALLVYLYLRVNHSHALNMFNKFQRKSTVNEEGIFWLSDWTQLDTCGESDDQQNMTLVATAYALMAYVHLNHSDSFKIASWLVAQRNSNGLYESLSDTALVMRSLSEFKDWSKTSFSLVTNSMDCYLPLDNYTDGIDFTLEKSIDPTTGALKMNICFHNLTDPQLLVSLPSAYVFSDEDITKESSIDWDWEIMKKPKMPEYELNEDGNKVLFKVATATLKVKNCFRFTGYKLYGLLEAKDSEYKLFPGYIEITSREKLLKTRSVPILV